MQVGCPHKGPGIVAGKEGAIIPEFHHYSIRSGLFSIHYLEQAASPVSSLPVTSAGQAGEPTRLAHTLTDGEEWISVSLSLKGNFIRAIEPTTFPDTKPGDVFSSSIFLLDIAAVSFQSFMKVGPKRFY